MIGRLFLGAAAVLLAGGAASAQSAQQRYQGTFFVTEASRGCVTDSGTVAGEGDNYVFVFRTDNELQAMAIYGTRRAMAFVPDGGEFKKSGDYTGTYILSAGVPRQTSAKYSGLKITPGKFDDKTETVVVTGKLADFEGTVGCDVSFEAGGIRRPGF